MKRAALWGLGLLALVVLGYFAYQAGFAVGYGATQT